MSDFECRICGNDFDNEAKAKKCEARGIVMFTRKVSDHVKFMSVRKSAVTNTWVREIFEGVI